MKHLPRRLVSIPAVAIALPLLVLATPLALPIAVLVDLAGGLRRLPTARLWLFAIVFLAHEWIGQLYALFLWITGGFGYRLHHGRHRGMQGWWAGSLLRWARRLLGVQLDLDNLGAIPTGEVLVFSRHASMVDAVLPAYIFAGELKRSCHYVLKKELRWVPNIDVFGHRLGNHFVDRNGDRDREVAEIAQMAAQAQPGAALIIFPEGTYATPTSKTRVQASLERRGDRHGALLNKQLTHLLPPRPAGSVALLETRPSAPIVILGHIGLEGVANLSGLRSNLPAVSPVMVRWWTTGRAEIDEGDQGITWLENQWRTLDRWVGQQHHHQQDHARQRPDVDQ